MTIVYHLFPGNMGHHVPNMVSFFIRNEDLIGSEVFIHKYIIYGGDKCDIEKIQEKLQESKSIEYLGKSVSLLFFKLQEIDKSNLLIIHSGFYKWIWPLLLLSRGTHGMKTTGLVMWGAETKPGKGLSGKLYDVVKSIAFRKLGAVAALDGYDEKTIKLRFGNSVNTTRAFYSVYKYDWTVNKSRIDQTSKMGKSTKILLGNSAWPESRHIDGFELLSKYRNENVEIICPLGYPCQSEYKGQVIRMGKKIFGNKCRLIDELLGNEEYDQLLSTVDILVFLNKSQQGLHNIYYFLSHGKKIFLPKNSATFREIESWGGTVMPTEDIRDMTFQKFKEMDNSNAINNIEVAKQNISEEIACLRWGNMLNILLGYRNS